MINEKNKLTHENQMAIQNGNDKSKQEDSVKPIKKKYCNRLFILFFLVLVGGVMGSDYALWKELQQTKAEVATTINNIQTQPKPITGNITIIEDAIKKLQKKQSEQSDILTSLHRNTHSNYKHWIIAEIEYLLMIAMHQLTLEKDIASALSAIEIVDLKLKNLRDPKLLPAKKQLVEIINKLRATNHTDIAGMAIYLAQMVELSASLPLKSEIIKKENTNLLPDENKINNDLDAKPFWKKFPLLLWQEIKSLIIIKHSNETRSAFLLPDEEYFLYQNLRLELESARLSVLRTDSENFSASIILIQSWLRTYFDINNSAVINMMETLDKMQAIKLDSEPPDISSSVKILRAYLRDMTSEAVHTEETSKERNRQ